MPESRTSVLTATATARPKRVAILVDRETITLDDLDQLMQRCATFWGGGFWPIIPTDGNTISNDWWSLLEAVDPDIVYAVCTIGDALFDRIHHRLAPARLINVGAPPTARRDGFLTVTFHEALALEAYSIVSYHAQRRAHLPATRFLYLTASGMAATDRRFALRNFGVIQATVGTRIAFEAVQRDDIQVQQTSKVDLLNKFVGYHGELVVPRDLSILYAPRPFDLEYDDFARGFHLVVGDSVDDALLAWNRPLTSDGQAGRDLIWIDTASARDQEFVRLVGQWIRRVFWNNNQGRRGVVLSCSEDVALLRSVGDTIREVAMLGCDPIRLTPGQFPFRAKPAYRRLHYPALFEEPPRRTEQIPLSNDQGRLAVPRPPFATATSKQEEWMVDLDIEYTLDPPRYTNHSDLWRVPRRAIVGRHFSNGRSHARVVVGGLPTVSVNATESSIPLGIPSKRAILAHLLEPLPSKDSDTAGFPRTRFKSFSTSEQGRRFRGMVDLFGGVTQAGRAFEETFWRTIFLDLAGKPAEAFARREEIVLQELQSLVPSSSPAKASSPPEPAQDVARRIVTRLHSLEPHTQTVTRGQLKSLFGQICTEMIGTATGERRIRFDDHASLELESFLETGILLQGVMLKCPHCGIGQWNIVDGLASTMRCDGCTSHFAFPIEPEWRFRLNGLVHSALARDSVLPLLHAVHSLTDPSKDMALVIAPQDLRESYEGQVVTDLDIVVVADGKFIIGEVKAQPAAFDEATLATLTHVAEEIRPDRVVVAAPGTSWPVEVRARIDRMRETLARSDVEVEDRLLEW